eukprot:6207412-Pleurochrysis_carterae.AAC.3
MAQPHPHSVRCSSLRRHGDLLAQNLTYDVQAALKRAAREGALNKFKRGSKLSNKFSMAARSQLPTPIKPNVQSDATLSESSVTEDSWAELLRKSKTRPSHTS